MTRPDPAWAIWREFDAAWYEQAYPIVRDLLSRHQFASPEAVYLAVGEALHHSPNAWFCETWYLDSYKPVRDCVEAGEHSSGFEHFCLGGYTELAPHWLFDPAFYLDRFRRVHRRDFDPAVDGDPYGNFLRFGQHLGLSGHRLFDPAVYLTMAPYDIRSMSSINGPYSTFLMQVLIKATEPVVSNLFDPVWYAARYPEVIEEIANGQWSCALHHYLANQSPVRFDPSPRFSEQAYLAYYPGIAEAVENGSFRNGFDHFLRHGQAERRFFAPVAVHDAGHAASPWRAPAVTASFPLGYRYFDNVTFLPTTRDTHAPERYSFGVMSDAGEPLMDFRHPWLSMRSETPSVTPTPGTFIYGGVLTNHFGHVLRDGLARLWFLRERPDLPVLWHWMDHQLPHDMWPDWLEQIWAILGLRGGRHLRITAPLRVEKVILPRQALPAPNVLHQRQAVALAVVDSPGPCTGNRVWLSRSALPQQFGRIEREAELEEALARSGWTVLHPEQMPVVAQANTFATAGVVAGFAGSAFHAVLLARCPRARLILVERPGLDRTFFEAVARARGLRQCYATPDLQSPIEYGAKASNVLADPMKLAGCICALAEED